MIIRSSRSRSTVPFRCPYWINSPPTGIVSAKRQHRQQQDGHIQPASPMEFTGFRFGFYPFELRSIPKIIYDETRHPRHLKLHLRAIRWSYKILTKVCFFSKQFHLFRPFKISPSSHLPPLSSQTSESWGPWELQGATQQSPWRAPRKERFWNQKFVQRWINWFVKRNPPKFLVETR